MADVSVAEAVAAETAAVTVAEEAGTAAATAVVEPVVAAETAAKAAGTETFPRANLTTAEAAVPEPTPVVERMPAVAGPVACPEIDRWVHGAEAAAAGSVEVVVAEAVTAAAGAGW